MNISFAKTTQPFLDLNKTVTRRLWKPATAARFQAGSIHSALSSLPYAKNCRRLGKIRAVRNAYLEPLGEISEAELMQEGGIWETKNHFFLEFGKPITLELLATEVYVARFIPVSLFYQKWQMEIPVELTFGFYLKAIFILGYSKNALPTDEQKIFAAIEKNFEKANRKLQTAETATPVFSDPLLAKEMQTALEHCFQKAFGCKNFLELEAEYSRAFRK